MTDRTPAVGDIITTAEELDALPEGSVILDRTDFLMPRYGEGWEFDNCCGRYMGSEDVDLPATVLHIPGQEAPDWRAAHDEAVRLLKEARSERDYARLALEVTEESWHNAEAQRRAAVQTAGTVGNRLGKARADRDRARSIAVALEQENAERAHVVDYLESQITHLDRLARRRLELLARLRAEAEAAHSVIEQVGLMHEWLTGSTPLGIAPSVADMLRQILDGATFEEVRDG